MVVVPDKTTPQAKKAIANQTGKPVQEDNKPFTGKKVSTKGEVAEDNKPFTGKKVTVKRDVAEDNKPFTGKKVAPKREVAEDNKPFTGKKVAVKRDVAEDNKPFTGKKVTTKTEVAEDNKPFTGKQVTVKREVAEDNKPFTGKQIGSKKSVKECDIAEDNKPFTGKKVTAKTEVAEDNKPFTGKKVTTKTEVAEDNKPFTGSKPTNKFQGKRVELKQLNEGTENKLPEDTPEAVYADCTSADQGTAKEVANNNARSKFTASFPGKESVKFVETAHRTDDNKFRYVVGLKVKAEGAESEETDVKQVAEAMVKKSFYPSTTKGDILEIIRVKLNETKVPVKQIADESENIEDIEECDTTPKTKLGENGMPAFLKFDAIKNSGGETTTKPTTTPTTKPGEKDKKRRTLNPGPGANPKPKM
jgi:hypothetical protein